MVRTEQKSGRTPLSPDELEQRALAMRAVGWLLLAVDGIVAVFVFVGIRTGSLLWLYWTAIEGALGLALIAAGMRLEEMASRERGHTGEPLVHAGGEAGQNEAA
jgi:hypothetical protein